MQGPDIITYQPIKLEKIKNPKKSDNFNYNYIGKIKGATQGLKLKDLRNDDNDAQEIPHNHFSNHHRAWLVKSPFCRH